MAGVLAGSAARVAAGVGVVACAAVIALAAGGSGVFGGLGSLLGRNGSSLEVAKAPAPPADIVAAPTASERAGALHRRGPATTPRKPSTRHPRSSAPRRPATKPAPGTGIPPATPPTTPLPTLPPPPPSPAPGTGQAVSALGESVKEIVDRAPPQTQPITKPVDDAVDTLMAACQGLPVCP
jgi:hypothetical protein